MTEELKLLERAALDFAAKELVDGRVERDSYPFAPLFSAILEKTHELGFTGIMLPEEMGGSAQGITGLATVLGDISRTDASLAGVIFTTVLAQEVMRNAKAKELLAGLIGDATDFTGSLLAFPSYIAPGQVKNPIRARAVDGHYALSGKLGYLVLGNVARHALVPAAVEGRGGLSFFLVDLSAAGVSLSEPVVSLGLRACPAVDVTFSDTLSTLVGEAGGGEDYLARASD
ncbi:MAG: acyl-CoA dehydrogenase, partial [Deltaproteobacteria bacterium HGW-Deltaproteobacteria-17]